MERYLLLAVLCAIQPAAASGQDSATFIVDAQYLGRYPITAQPLSLSWADLVGSASRDYVVSSKFYVGSTSSGNYHVRLRTLFMTGYRYNSNDYYPSKTSDMKGDVTITLTCASPKPMTVSRTVHGYIGAARSPYPYATFPEILGFTDCEVKVVVKGSTVTGTVSYPDYSPSVWGNDGQPVIRYNTMSTYISSNDVGAADGTLWTGTIANENYTPTNGFTAATSNIAVQSIAGDRVRVDAPITMRVVEPQTTRSFQNFTVKYANAFAVENEGCKVSVAGYPLSALPIPFSVRIETTGGRGWGSELRASLPMGITCATAGRKIMNIIVTHRAV